MSEPIARLHGATIGYHRTAPVLHDVSLEIAPGESVGIIGETGSGKTTIARTLLGLTQVTTGEVSVAGRDLRSLRGASLRAFRREGVVR